MNILIIMKIKLTLKISGTSVNHIFQTSTTTVTKYLPNENEEIINKNA